MRPGESTIFNVRQIDRGYEAIENRLQALGARSDALKTEPAATRLSFLTSTTSSTPSVSIRRTLSLVRAVGTFLPT